MVLKWETGFGGASMSTALQAGPGRHEVFAALSKQRFLLSLAMPHAGGGRPPALAELPWSAALENCGHAARCEGSGRVPDRKGLPRRQEAAAQKACHPGCCGDRRATLFIPFPGTESNRRPPERHPPPLLIIIHISAMTGPGDSEGKWASN